jgi:hypothetical protein
MDRSFLSRPEVIEASRRFVCVRLATYEDPAEAAFLKGFTPTRSGELENTVFGLLAPDGKEKLVRSGRGPRGLFADAPAMAQAMDRIAARYPPKSDPGPAPLPKVASVRLGVNVAAADDRPLVVVSAADAAVRAALVAKVAELAWRPEFVGRFVYAVADRADDLNVVGRPADGLLVVQPEEYGRSGTVLARCPADADPATLAATMRAGAAKLSAKEKSFGGHVREGRRQGVFWETAVPVTDPMEKQARERGRVKR